MPVSIAAAASVPPPEDVPCPLFMLCPACWGTVTVCVTVEAVGADVNGTGVVSTGRANCVAGMLSPRFGGVGCSSRCR